MPDPQQAIFAVVLAAGSASRFGSTKQAAALGGIALVRRSVLAASKACGNRVLTVIGHDPVTVYSAMDSRSGFVIVNDDHAAGIGGSIAVAARALPRSAVAMLLVLADQPLVTATHLRALINAWSGAGDEIVATEFAATLGPPVLFPRAAFTDLASQSGDRGARALLRDRRFRLKSVRFEAAAADVDTPADLDAIAQKLLHFGDD